MLRTTTYEAKILIHVESEDDGSPAPAKIVALAAGEALSLDLNTESGENMVNDDETIVSAEIKWDTLKRVD